MSIFRVKRGSRRVFQHPVKGDEEMRGNYFGYDGPSPPWNDAIPHHYIFTLYALDIAKCPVQGNFTGAEVFKAISGHILAKASLTGVYSMNPAVRL
ncbi:MAG TPA: YbhB/YbcL family Raf kinase inhibitor-like protein [Burkholderiales bacterium]|nr:YbhB/YbcL family Raf kinase inhibitor-like protein [Burkholderiales bacterium]